MQKYFLVRGVRDLIPDTIRVRNYILIILSQIFNSFNCTQIDFPVLENYELYSTVIGSNIITKKEMYHFYDRNNNIICLRPEGTASFVRFILRNNFLIKCHNRFWYLGPMFRYERPQKDRYRQFTQLGVEFYDTSSIFDEYGLLNIVFIFCKQTNILNKVFLEINFILIKEEKKRFKYVLWEFICYYKAFCLINKKQLIKNVLSVLKLKYLFYAPFLLPSSIHFLKCFNYKLLLCLLIMSSVPLKINEDLVRGLSYYTGVVFEWKSYVLQSSNAFCSGGRYDFLFDKISKKKIKKACVGFAFGIDRVCSLFKNCSRPKTIDIYFIIFATTNKKVFFFINLLQKKYFFLIVAGNYKMSSVTNQYKKFSKINVRSLCFFSWQQNFYDTHLVFKFVEISKKYKLNFKNILLFFDDYIIFLYYKSNIN